MNFVNNWRQQLALEQGAESAELELPDGEYMLTVSDAIGAAATRWEYVHAVVVGGIAELNRSQEGSAAQDWPDGSWIYCSCTAGGLSWMFSQLVAQADQIAELSARVTALEPVPPPRVTVTVGSPGPWSAGFDSASFGSVSPAQLEIPGFGSFSVQIAQFSSAEPREFMLIFEGHFPVTRIVSINVQGVGELARADADIARNEPGPTTVFVWRADGTEWFGAVGEQRNVDFTFAAD